MLELKVDAMSCAHCERTIRQTVQRIEPQARVEVDLSARTVRIDGARDADAIREALAEEGYPAV